MEITPELLAVNAQNVFSFLNNATIFKAYCDPKMKFNTPFSSPFREDKKPSFVIYEKGFYMDFASGEKGNAITFVMNLYKVNFNVALLMIIKEFNLGSKFNCFDSSVSSEKKAAFENPKNSLSLEHAVISVKRKAFTSKDGEYWSQYNISEKDLNFANIIPISHFFVNEKMFIAEALSYAFLEKKDGVVSIKVYQPKSLYLKWISGNNGSVWEMWSQLPQYGTHVIITSSRKDALSIIKNTNIPSTAFQSETTIPKLSVMNEVFSRFDNVYLLLDNDFDKKTNWGQVAAEKLIAKYPKLKNLVIPSPSKCKDFSDVVSIHGPVLANTLIRKLILQKDKELLLV